MTYYLFLGKSHYQRHISTKLNLIILRYCFVTAKEVEGREKKLLSRFKSANTLPNTREYHRFEPLNKNQMIVRLFSNDTDVEIENLK